MARSNGVASAFTYDAAGRLLSVAHRDRASAVLSSESLRYDAAGRRSSRVREDGATDFFRYDPAGQVTAAAYGLAAAADPVAFPASQTFAYDPAGNRTQAVDDPLTASYQANAVNQYSRILVGAAETIPSYDALGNLLEDDRAAYAWDADIHLLSIAPKDGGPAAAYRYDALHRRVARLEGSTALTYFVHDGWNVVAEYAGSPGSAALAHEVRHVWGEDLGGGLQTAGGVGGLLASVRASGANWAHYDGNGNVVLLTDGAGAASARYAYDAFGRLKSSSGPAAEANRYRFSTKPQERAAALSYYGYRYYAPSHGRWLSRDPLEEEGGVNLYAMSGNDPISKADFLGLLVTAVLDRKNNTFTVTDNDTKRSVTAQAFTGGHVSSNLTIISPGLPLEIPAPGGVYNIVDNPNSGLGKEDWYGLFMQDSRMDDYLDDNGKERSGVRLHLGGVSHGCVTVNRYSRDAGKKWQEIRDTINSTKKEKMKFREGPHFWNGTGETTNYGTLTIK
jgi:RHS repeat-associated protein